MANHEVFNAYRSHASGHRISTNTALQTAILSQYPDHCLTATSHDLIKYADAGHASAIVVQDGPPNLFNRDYDSNLRRSNDGDPSTMLKTVIVFAFYDYSWQGHEYRVLVAEGQNSLLSGPCDRRFYILSKPHAGEVAGKSLSKAADELILAVGIWVENSDDEVWVFDQGRWVKDKALWVGAQDADFDAIIMPPEMKSAIMRDVMGFFDAKEHYREFGTPWKRGLIFHGPPGNGKTMTLRAIMRKLMSRREPIPTLYVKTLAQRSFGPQWSVRLIFTKARQAAPCLLLFEDIDSLVTDEVRSYFLNEVDGLENNDGILMIGSTNNLDKLDLGLAKRPSRFDRKYRFSEPEFEERLRYCEDWREKLSNNPSVEMTNDVPRYIATLTEGFSFAYIKEAYIGTFLALIQEIADEESSGAKDGGKYGRLGDLLEKHVGLLKVEMSEISRDDSKEKK